MGKGGGLIILPQKSWNPWRNDNKAKVARDEARHNREVAAKKKRREEVERQVRLEKLRGKTVTDAEIERRIEEAYKTITPGFSFFL